MNMLKRFLLLLVIALLGFVAYLLIQTARFSSVQTWPEPVPRIEIPESAAQHLAQAIRIPTVSYDDRSQMDTAAFDRFVAFLGETYPLVDSLLEKQVFQRHSLCYRWPGRQTELAPIILMGHYDVVPAEATGWRQEPFSGVIVQDTLWGRGAADDKISVIGLLEAVTYLLQQNFQPERDVYLAFGHDEEIGGKEGAATIARSLTERGVRAEFVLDEGLNLTQGLIPGIEQEVGLICLAEKGYLSLELSVELEGGHASIPKSATAIDVLAGAVARLKQQPVPPKITAPLKAFMRYIGPEMPFVQKMAFANAGIFSGMIIDIYAQSGPGDALIRTTTAPTIFQAGSKDNVVPQTARAVVNFRLLPGDDTAFVHRHVREVVADERIRIRAIGHATEASRISPPDSKAYQFLSQSLKEVYPGLMTAPTILVGGADARYYETLSENVFRFSPFHVHPGNVNMIHGRNERISVAEFGDAIRFYVRLMENSHY